MEVRREHAARVADRQGGRRRGAIQPGPDDFATLWLLFRTLLPQVGGRVLMLARRDSWCLLFVS
jgi:hypothetical protein